MHSEFIPALAYRLLAGPYVPPCSFATEAAKLYTQALAGAPEDGTLHGNRSAAHLALGLLDDAAWDARRAVSLRPDWPKAYYRLGCACLALGQWTEAEAALAQGLQLEPGADDMGVKLAAARQQLAAEASARQAQAATERRGLVAKLRAARQADRRLAQLNQFKQAMSAPDWELEDLEWCGGAGAGEDVTDGR